MVADRGRGSERPKDQLQEKSERRGRLRREVMLLRTKPLRSTVIGSPFSEENSFFVTERGPVLREEQFIVPTLRVQVLGSSSRIPSFSCIVIREKVESIE